MLGQVRALAVDPRDQAELLALARDGWIEAAGQTLSTDAFHALYRQIGRRWTSVRVPSDEFALPNIDRPATRSRSASRPPLLHFICVGRDISAMASANGPLTVVGERR